MVKCRGGDQPLQRTQAPANIGMDEEAPHSDDKHDHGGDQRPLHALRGAETQDVHGDQAAEVDKYEVDGMGACADKEVDLPGVVVN